MRIHNTVIDLAMDIKGLVSAIRGLEALDFLDQYGEISALQRESLDMVREVSLMPTRYTVRLSRGVHISGATYNGNPITAVLEYGVGGSLVEFRMPDDILLAFVDVIMSVYKDPIQALRLAPHILDCNTLRDYAIKQPFAALKYAAHLMPADLRDECVSSLDYDSFSHRVSQDGGDE